MKKAIIAGLVSIIVLPVFLITIVAGSIIPGAPPTEGELVPGITGTFIVPVKKGQYIFNERFGSYTELAGGHFGVDMAGRIGTIVYSASDGIVMENFDGCSNTPSGQISRWSNYCSTPRGNHLIIKTIIDEKEIYLAYYHFQKGTVLPTPGTEVKQGQPIAQMGSSGMVTGPHLHFEMQTIYNSYPSSAENRIDPEGYLPLTPFGEYVEEDDDYHIKSYTERGEENVEQTE